MPIITCKVGWCDRDARALGYCVAHYKRHLNGREMDAPFKGTLQRCTAPSCHRDALASGYCNAHYIRAQNGRPLAPAVRVRAMNRVCSVPGCGHKHMGHGLCSRHYRQESRRRFWASLILARGDRCSVCGKRYPIAVYDLHHRDPAAKEFALSNAIGNKNIDSLLAEAEKCDIVCANCHRVMHAKGWASRLIPH